MSAFATVLARAEARKGGEEALARLIPQTPDPARLAAVPDDRVLAEMAKRIFSAGFVWSVIEAKWPGFEEAFLGFDVNALLFQPDEFWMDLASDKRIVRNGQKIMAVKANAAFVSDISREHGSFAAFLASWPPSDVVSLLALLAKKGARLGGNSGQMLLRFLGYDTFVLSGDVVAALRLSGLDIAETPSSKGDMARIQAQFNAWAQESGLGYTQLSRVCAMSAGDNYSAEHLLAMRGEA